MKNNAFKIFSNELDLETLSPGFGELGFEVSYIETPNSAYEIEIIELKCTRLEEKSVKIIVERSWWPDGVKYEDKSLSIRLDGETKLNLDIEDMLQNRHRENLRKIIWTKLAECLSEISGKNPNVA